MYEFGTGSPTIKMLVGHHLPFQPPVPLTFMKRTERKIIQAFSKHYPRLGDFSMTHDMSPYDFECDYYIIEIKSRNKRYDPWIIERIKVDSNTGISESLKKDFLYLTEYNGNAYIWNISQLIRDNYDFKWEQRQMPWQTEFDKNQVIQKQVGYLFEKKCKQIKLWN